MFGTSTSNNTGVLVFGQTTTNTPCYFKWCVDCTLIPGITVHYTKTGLGNVIFFPYSSIAAREQLYPSAKLMEDFVEFKDCVVTGPSNLKSYCASLWLDTTQLTTFFPNLPSTAALYYLPLLSASGTNFHNIPPPILRWYNQQFPYQSIPMSWLHPLLIQQHPLHLLQSKVLPLQKLPTPLLHPWHRWYKNNKCKCRQWWWNFNNRCKSGFPLPNNSISTIPQSWYIWHQLLAILPKQSTHLFIKDPQYSPDEFKILTHLLNFI